MQFGATFWTNFEEKLLQMLDIYYIRDKNGVWALDLGAKAYFSPTDF